MVVTSQVIHFRSNKNRIEDWHQEQSDEGRDGKSADLGKKCIGGY
jgi:hypothetical protein